MSKFKGKVMVITGAGSGIGQALARQLAARGVRLALSDVNEAGLQETTDSLPAETDFRAYRLDVADRDAFAAHARQVVGDFGTAHGIINNAGVTVVGTVEHLSLQDIDWQLGINLFGTIYGTKAFLPTFLAQGEGWIVNLSSIFGLVGYPCQSAYNISKFGVRGLTEALWQELEGTGVHAICVHPGGIATKIESSSLRCAAANEDEAHFAGLAKKLLVTPPERCAADIIAGMERNARRVITGKLSSTVFWLSRLMPNTYPAIIKLLSR